MGILSNYSQKRKQQKLETKSELLFEQILMKLSEAAEQKAANRRAIRELFKEINSNSLLAKKNSLLELDIEYDDPVMMKAWTLEEEYELLNKKFKDVFENDFYKTLARGPISKQKADRKKEFSLSTKELFSRKDTIFLIQEGETVFVFSEGWRHHTPFSCFDVDIYKPYKASPNFKKLDGNIVNFANGSQGWWNVDNYSYAYELDMQSYDPKEKQAVFVVKPDEDIDSRLDALEMLFEGESGIEALKDALSVITSFCEECEEFQQTTLLLKNQIEEVVDDIDVEISRQEQKLLEAYNAELDMDAYQLDRLNTIGDKMVEMAEKIYEQ